MEDIQNYLNLLSSLLLPREKGAALAVGRAGHWASKRLREERAKHGVSEKLSG